MSIAGGLHNALLAGSQLGCDCIQIFVKNQRQWHARSLKPDDVGRWHQARTLTRIGPVMAHSAYLINLACPDRRIWRKSVNAFIDEIRRCEAVNIPWIVTHPGSHGGQGETAGIRRIVHALREIIDRTADCDVTILLENTAGQGTGIGYRFDHLAEIIAAADRPDRVAVCLDTCHAHAAGYDLSSQEGYERLISDIRTTVGLTAIKCVHLNDSKKAPASRIDRHQHIGMGTIGLRGFQRLLQDKRLPGVPGILETPKEKAPDGRDYDEINLALLRKLARKA